MRQRVVEAGSDWSTSPLGLLVPPRRRRAYDRPVAVDLFAGAGGFSMGLHQAGFHVAAAVECDPSAALTYLVNLGRLGVKIHYDGEERKAAMDRAVRRHLGLTDRRRGAQPASASAPGTGRGGLRVGGTLAGDGWISSRPPSEPGCEHFWLADVRSLTGAQILEQLQLEVGEVDLVVGGPPCQGFSVAGKRQVMDPRNSLVFEFVRLVLEIRPRAMAMENVPAILSMVTPEGIPVVDEMCRLLECGNYGSREALRKALLVSAGCGAAVQGRKNRRGKYLKDDDAAGPAVAEPDQLELFGELA
jgi:DNA (cytosine-5)-methyltransferase 1